MATKTAPEDSNDTPTNPRPRVSRAVQRTVEAGSYVDCAICGERIKFQAKHRHQQVICNVYVDGVWNRVEHFHLPCYETSDKPYGEPEASDPMPNRSAAAKAAAKAQQASAEGKTVEPEAKPEIKGPAKKASAKKTPSKAS